MSIGPFSDCTLKRYVKRYEVAVAKPSIVHFICSLVVGHQYLLNLRQCIALTSEDLISKWQRVCRRAVFSVDSLITSAIVLVLIREFVLAP